MKEGRYKPWELNRFTIPQLICLGNEHPPGVEKLDSMDKMLERIRMLKAKEAAWSAPE
jgi:hypothetical protein